MRGMNKALVVLAASLLATGAFAQTESAAQPQPVPAQAGTSALDQVIDKLAAQEEDYIKNMRH